MARMLGRQRQSGCGNFGCRLCGPGDTRLAKRIEQRQIRREIAEGTAEPRPGRQHWRGLPGVSDLASDCFPGCGD